MRTAGSVGRGRGSEVMFVVPAAARATASRFCASARALCSEEQMLADLLLGRKEGCLHERELYVQYGTLCHGKRSLARHTRFVHTDKTSSARNPALDIVC